MMKKNNLPIVLKPLTESFIREASQLYESSFPYAERRPTQQWLLKYQSSDIFKIDAIIINGEFDGFISYWLMDSFIYVEHFATMPQCRGKGIGGCVIELFRNKVKCPIVLEVEPPADDVSRRRIGFYKRHGFHQLSQAYMQPSYHEGGSSFPLQIMCTDVEYAVQHFSQIVQSIYRHVYGVVGRL